MLNPLSQSKTLKGSTFQGAIISAAYSKGPVAGQRIPARIPRGLRRNPRTGRRRRRSIHGPRGNPDAGSNLVYHGPCHARPLPALSARGPDAAGDCQIGTVPRASHGPIVGRRPPEGPAVRAQLGSLDDDALLARFQDGEAAAFAVLLERYRGPIFNFILRSVRNPHTAEELMQEVFLRVVQRSAEFKGESKFSTWLYTIARNQCIDHSRKMVFRRHRSLDAPLRVGEDSGQSLLDRVETKDPKTDRDAIANELGARIAEAVELLPTEQREVFLLRQIQGLPFKEIAIIVEVPENTVKSRMRYALERLQQALAEYEDYVRQVG